MVREMTRYTRTKRDSNHGDVTKALERVGCTVLDLAAVGDGAPDLCVGYGTRNYLIEVVGPDKLKRFPPCGRTDNQREWHEVWRGSVLTVTSAEDAIEQLGISTIGKEENPDD